MSGHRNKAGTLRWRWIMAIAVAAGCLAGAEVAAAAANSAQPFVAGMLGALVAVVIALSVRHRISAAARVASQVNVDPLTGAGNRHQLEIDTAGRVQNPAYGWHLVASIDIDRFKLTNDTWGHAVGDMVLVEIAQRLNNVVSGWKGGAKGIHGAVIRICGDEFLMVLHAETPINEAIVRQQLDEIRAGHIQTADGRSIELAFSAGVVTVIGQADLEDLMQAANLACYEDKAQRRVERERHQHPAPELSAPSHGPRISDI